LKLETTFEMIFKILERSGIFDFSTLCTVRTTRSISVFNILIAHPIPLKDSEGKYMDWNVQKSARSLVTIIVNHLLL
jgi:hypothetical protein